MRFDLQSLWNADPRPIELFAAAVALWWAIILLCLLEPFVEAPSYVALHQLAPAWLWGSGFGLQGLLQTVGVVGDVGVLRVLSAMVAALIWTTVATAMLTTDPALPSAGTYLLLALLCVWVVARGPSYD